MTIRVEKLRHGDIAITLTGPDGKPMKQTLSGHEIDSVIKLLETARKADKLSFEISLGD